MARETLPEKLAARGIAVDVVLVYRTAGPPAAAADGLKSLLPSIDIVLFTSSSTVTNLCAHLGDEAPRLLGGATLASIGPVTTRTAEDHGLTIAVTSPISTTAGLVDALERATPKR